MKDILLKSNKNQLVELIRKVIYNNLSEHSSTKIEPQILYIDDISTEGTFKVNSELRNFVKLYSTGVYI